MTPQHHADDRPVTISRYRTIERIGTGGMGSVYRAYDPMRAREVIIKVLPSYLQANPVFRKRFQHEAMLASSVSHPNVASIYDVGEFGGAPYIVTEYVAGTSLATRTAAGPLPIGELLAISIQIGKALAAAHEHQVIHRDLKPSNVIITPSGKAMLVDFGLARPASVMALEVEADAHLQTQVGSPLEILPYTPPEQLLGEPIDSRSDIYSFGAVLYEMATGSPPFRGETGAGLVASILHSKPSPPGLINHRIPHRLGEIILKCLRKRPEERFQSMQEVLDALLDRVVKGIARLEGVCGADSAPPVALPGMWLGIRPHDTSETFGGVVLALSLVMALIGLVPLYGTALGFAMTFGASVIGYECYLLLKALKDRR